MSLIHFTSTPNAFPPKVACGRSGLTERVAGGTSDVSCPDCKTSDVYLAQLWRMRNS